MKYLIFITLLFFFGVSCKKETSVVIQAQDYNTGHGTAYAGQEYAVSESWTPFQETKSKIVATGVLDDNGKASFNLKMKNNRKYVLGVSEPDNICYGGLVQHYLDHDKNNTVNFKYAQCSYLKINLNNVNCFDNNDQMHFRSKHGPEEWGSWSTYRYGCYTLSSPDYFEVPYGWTVYETEVIRNSITYIQRDSLFLDKSGFGELYINY
nr:hypothetical protein [uncultured Brumimicrobium sp.]